MNGIKLALTASEADLQAAVMELAVLCGWRCVHIRTVPEYRRGKVQHLTPYEGHGGLPDLILAKNGRVLLVELKAQQRHATPEQRLWLAAAGANGKLWKPSDMTGDVVATLRDGPTDQRETA